MLWLAGWCIAACFLLAFAASRVRLREIRVSGPGGALA
jgi:hypothetical protein